MSFSLFVEQSFLFISENRGQTLHLHVALNNSRQEFIYAQLNCFFYELPQPSTDKGNLETGRCSMKRILSSWIHVEVLRDG